MSSGVQFASQESNNGHEDSKDSRRLTDLTAANLSLSPEALFKAAISLKDQVVQTTWKGSAREEDYADSSVHTTDPTVYSGLLGTAFSCLRSYQATGCHRDLLLCAEIVETCAASAAPATTRHVTFLGGIGGIYALGAVAANWIGEHTRRDFYMDLFFQVAQEKALPAGPEEGGLGMSYDLLHGRAGFLWAALFINKYIGPKTVPNELLMPVVDAVLAGGRAGASDNTACPLMYRWHGTRYWGAAHGLAGILQVLLHFPLSKVDMEDVKGTLRYMMSKRFPHSGNYPSCEGNTREMLVQWSHGATGIAITLCKASQVFPYDREFRDAAIEAGEIVWKNGLLKKVGLADGVAGNAYAFLSLYRLTGESIYEERAKAFASFLCHNAKENMTVGHSDGADYAYTLFQGLAGVVCLWFDLLEPENSRFPGYEI